MSRRSCLFLKKNKSLSGQLLFKTILVLKNKILSVKLVTVLRVYLITIFVFLSAHQVGKWYFVESQSSIKEVNFAEGSYRENLTTLLS